ncbi:MAG: hypothetical protein J6C99_04010 [Lachnospiraceae bacterium]|nr:hypothetical protein [Lachnospiraceae bacterium]
MKSEFEKTFEQLADFHTLAGYDGWMVGACVYEQREAAEERVSGTEFGCGNDLTVVQNQKIKIQNSCKSEIVKKTASFAVMRNQIEEDGIVYQLELHVVKPEVQGAVTSKQEGMEKNMAMNEEKSKPEERRMDLHHSVGTEETTDTGGGKTFSFTHSDILRFVDAVGDTNSIHRTAHAVVPGLLMVEWMLDMWMRKQPETETDVELKAGMKNKMHAGVQVETQNEMQAGMPDSKTFICRFRFEKPVFVDEKLQVQARTERGKQIYECKREDKEIVWNMRIL